MIRFDINTISRIAFAQTNKSLGELPKSLGKINMMVEDSLDNIEGIIESMHESVNHDYKDFTNSYIELLMEVLSIAYIKNIDLNKFINISIPEDRKVIEKY